MELILDSDSIIKLNQIGALEIVVKAFPCVIPQAVYQETVIDGRQRGRPDAEFIDRIVTAWVEIAVAPQGNVPFPVRGPGEREVLALAMDRGGDAWVVSDDRQFVNRVTQIRRSRLLPIDLIPVLARYELISMTVAREFLELFRPLTRGQSYLDALKDLEGQE
ncbi:MAG: hypothetical protein ACE5Q6_18860 [Dehalococcoidia bacterium]